MAASATASVSSTSDTIKQSKATENLFTVTSGSRLNLVSGKSIVFKPGTRVFSGGYLRASIVSSAKGQKSATQRYRKSKTAAAAEKTVEPAVIAETHNSISPFAARTGRALSESDDNDERLSAVMSDITGISYEQNRKLSGYFTLQKYFNPGRTLNFIHFQCIPLLEKREAIAVMRV